MLDFPIELGRTNELLERIAVALERIAGPVIERPPVRMTQPEDIRYRDDELAWMQELDKLERDALRAATLSDLLDDERINQSGDNGSEESEDAGVEEDRGE